MEIDYNKVIYNNKTIRDIIFEIEAKVDEVMQGYTCYPVPLNTLALALLIRDLIVDYNHTIPEVVHYFSKKYGY